MTMPPGYTTPPQYTPPAAPPVPPVDPAQQQQPPAAPPAPTPLSIPVQAPPAPPTMPLPAGMSQEQFNAFMADREAAVRREEKDKLYPRIEELNASVQTLTQEREARLQAEQDALQQAADEERLRQEAEMSSKDLIAQTEANFNRQLQELKDERDREAALRQREGEVAAAAEYRHRRLVEESDHIAPQLVDFVQGMTPEQIDQQIEMAKAKTAEILAQVQGAQLNQRRQAAPPIAGVPAVDMPGDQVTERTLTPQQIRDMPIEDYVANRQQILAAGSQRVAEMGPYAQ